MKFSARSRLTALIIAMAVLAAAIFWSAIVSWRAGRDARVRIEAVTVEAVHRSHGMMELALDMRSQLLAYEVTGDAAYWQKFQDRAKDLRTWLDVERAMRGERDRDKQRFDAIDGVLARYLRDAQNLRATRARGAQQGDLAQCVAQVQSGADGLLQAGLELSIARRTFIAESGRSLEMLQQLIFGSLLILLIFAGWGVRVVYRDMISPLQVRLIETKEIAERQEKLAALGVLAAGVAHEIRNPLTAIKARLYTQQKALPADSPARRDGEFIGKEIERLARIITDFLTFARPAEPHMETISAGDILRNAAELLAPQLATQEITLAVETPSDLKVSADAAQIQQVLINLVQNAADSIGHSGTIKLRAHGEELTLGGRLRKVVVFEVADSGKGIPREVQERLFDPFFTTKASGMGLGLSIAARIVEKHGGAIRYQTQIDRGTAFGVALPSGAEK